MKLLKDRLRASSTSPYGEMVKVVKIEWVLI